MQIARSQEATWSVFYTLNEIFQTLNEFFSFFFLFFLTTLSHFVSHRSSFRTSHLHPCAFVILLFSTSLTVFFLSCCECRPHREQPLLMPRVVLPPSPAVGFLLDGLLLLLLPLFLLFLLPPPPPPPLPPLLLCRPDDFLTRGCFSIVFLGRGLLLLLDFCAAVPWRAFSRSCVTYILNTTRNGACPMSFQLIKEKTFFLIFLYASKNTTGARARCKPRA